MNELISAEKSRMSVREMRGEDTDELESFLVKCSLCREDKWEEKGILMHGHVQVFLCLVLGYHI